MFPLLEHTHDLQVSNPDGQSEDPQMYQDWSPEVPYITPLAI